jgi:tetratricopeptide (TPR) repeat protein
VDAIVTGNIQVLPTQIRVTVQLIRVSDGFLMWADTFHETKEQLFALEDDVAGRVAQSVSVQLSRQAQVRLSRPSTRNSNAYLAYLKGRFFWNKRTEEGMRRSKEYFQKAIAEDVDYALAYSGLADSYIQLSSFGIEPTQIAYTSAKSAGLKALRLDGSSAEVHSTLGAVALDFERNWSKAEQEFKRSIELDPSNPIAYTRYAIDLVAMGRYEEALTQEEHALELDPLSLDLNLGLGRIYYLSGDYENAIETIQRIIELEPLFPRDQYHLGMIYITDSRIRDAFIKH